MSIGLGLSIGAVVVGWLLACGLQALQTVSNTAAPPIDVLLLVRAPEAAQCRSEWRIVRSGAGRVGRQIADWRWAYCNAAPVRCPMVLLALVSILRR